MGFMGRPKKTKAPPGERLERLLRRRRVSNTEFAKRVGVSTWRVGDWTRGSKPSGANAVKVAAETRLMGEEIRAEEWWRE